MWEVFMLIKYREILRLSAQELSNRGISSSCGCSRNTVADVLKKAEEIGIKWPLSEEVNDSELQNLMFPEKNKTDLRRLPDADYVHKEMAKSGVTLSLLWHEYTLECRERKEIPYSYRQFCRYYNRYVSTTKATMRIKRKPGELMEVDWAGQTMSIQDSLTGEEITAYIFVAALPCSQYSFVEGFLSTDSESWITAHLHAFDFFGGVTKMIVPDNLKTGVEKASRSEPVINRTYQEMAEHYQTIIMPARVRHPKDKPTVEGAVGIISTWILASLRKQQFFSISELNEAIKERLQEFNQKDFQKKRGSRLTAYLEEEKFALLPLPASSYEMASWKKATVQYDYHISVEKMYYSVPYEYIKHQVEVRVTRTMIEIFFKNFRIASHLKLHGKEGQLSTVQDHMPPQHQLYLNFTSVHFLKWAEDVGPNTLTTIKAILSANKNEKLALKSCMALSKLSDQYSFTRIEAACKKALEYSPRANLSSIKTILKNDQDQLSGSIITSNNSTSTTHGYVRGPEYYGRKDK